MRRFDDHIYAQLFTLTTDEVLQRWDVENEMKRDAMMIWDAWAGWPSSEQAAAVWHVAIGETGNKNVPVGLTTGKDLLKIDVERRDTESIRSFRDHHRKVYRSLGFESLTAYRYVDSEPTGAKKKKQRAAESWTLNSHAIPEFAANIHGSESGSVVSAKFDVGQTYASFRTMPQLPSNQSELVVAPPKGSRYGDHTVEPLEDFIKSL